MKRVEGRLRSVVDVNEGVKTRYTPPQRRPGCRHRTVTVGPGCSSVTVMVGPGRDIVTVTVGCGTGTLTVKVGVGFRPCCRLVAPRRAGTVIATISASPMAAAIATKALDRSRFRTFLRCLLPGRGACGVITPLMVDLGAKRAAAVASDAGSLGAELNAVSRGSGRACTAVGAYHTANGATVLLAEAWHGARWTREPAANPAAAFDSHPRRHLVQRAARLHTGGLLPRPHGDAIAEAASQHGPATRAMNARFGRQTPSGCRTSDSRADY